MYEDVVLRVKIGSRHGALEVEREPFLDAMHPCAAGKVKKQDQVKHQRRGNFNPPFVSSESLHHWGHRTAPFH